MIRRLIIFDSVLVLLLVFGVMKFREDWQAFEPAHQVSAIQPKAESLPALPAAVSASATSNADWTEIPTHNPFSFDRNDIAVLAPVEPPKPVGPKPILFGTMTFGQGWVAMLASGQTNNRNSRPIRVGESVDGWKVVEIASKTVVIEANSSRETLSMDPTQVVPREYTRTTGASAPPVVQSVGQPAPAQVTPSSAGPAAAGASNSPAAGPGTQRMCQVHTPFGATITRPCDDPAR